MSKYIEIPKLNPLFPFRTFISYGWDITYPHWHKEIEIIYCLKGTVNLGVNEQVLQLKEGEAYVFSSGQAHFFLASPDSERIVYQFDLKLFHSIENLADSDRPLYELFRTIPSYSRLWPQSVKEKINDLLLKLFYQSSQGVEGVQYALAGLLYQLVASFYRLPTVKNPIGQSQQSLKNKEVMDYLNAVFEYVEHHFLSAITIVEVANHVGFSPSYFSRFFKKHVGTSFSQYLTEYRINVAKYILGTSQLPMVEVASQAGFSSVKTFHHVFKSQVGVSPKQFQKKLNE
ncbi:AraC family transcriptional regulator [Enterococcus sp. AZ109]|uniref:AraC family transcriptional regulator n=1 Tax=Enterococcus sp. AZ109 TaxID=2774634 RepID=UPI003F26D7C5